MSDQTPAHDRAVERDVYHAVFDFQERVLVDFREGKLAKLPEAGFIATIRDADEHKPLDMLTPEWIAGTIEIYRHNLARKFRFTTPYLWCWVKDGSMVIDLVAHSETIEQVSTMLATGQIEPRIYDCRTGHTLHAIPWNQLGGPQ